MSFRFAIGMSLKKRFETSKKLVSLTMSEVGANLMALNLYPLGLFSGKEKGYRHPKAASNQRPVLLVHGIVHNPSAFYKLKKKMDEHAWQNIYTVNYSTHHGSLMKMVESLSKRVNQIVQQTQSTQIDIVAHSLGGLVARYYMTIGEGRGRVKNLITLGTPHLGTEISILLKGMYYGSLDSDLRTGSYLIRTLCEHTIPRGSKVISLFSPHDVFVWPRKNCFARGLPKNAFENIKCDHVGHMGLLYNDQVLETVMGRLSRNASQVRSNLV